MPAAEPTAAAPPYDDPYRDDEYAPRQESFLLWLLRSLGWRYISYFFLLIVLSGIWFLWCLPIALRSYVCPGSLIYGVERILAEGQRERAHDLVWRSQTYLGRVLRTGLENLGAGVSRASAIMQRCAELEEVKCRNRLNTFGMFSVLFWLVGILGFVDGLIMSFVVIATSPTAPKPSEIADGTGTALVTVLVALVISIPMVVVYCILVNCNRRLAAEARLQAEILLTRIDAGGKTGAIAATLVDGPK